ncbi:MAG: NAD(+)/NADH kinase [Thermoplasmata archaeon]
MVELTINFGVYGIVHEDENTELIGSLDSHPTSGKVMYHETLAERLDRKGYTLEEMEKANLDFMMTVGGDGTILRLLQSGDFNILGINTGRVGFLTSVELAELDRALELVNTDRYFIDERIKVKPMLNGKQRDECTNEIVVHTDRVAKIRGFEIYQGEKLVDRFRADGLIVSTPTGSTCYSMSAGGPIVDPNVDAFIVVPISPYKLATKPYVVPIDQEIRVKLTEKGKTCLMVLDGQEEFKVSSEDDIRFVKGEDKAKFIRFEKDFYKNIRKKLVWK